MVAVIIMLLYLIYMRSKLQVKAMQLDQDAYTPSDFCLIGRFIKF